MIDELLPEALKFGEPALDGEFFHGLLQFRTTIFAPFRGREVGAAGLEFAQPGRDKVRPLTVEFRGHRSFSRRGHDGVSCSDMAMLYIHAAPKTHSPPGCEASLENQVELSICRAGALRRRAGGVGAGGR